MKSIWATCIPGLVYDISSFLQTMEENKQNKLSVEDEEKSCIEKKKQQAHWRERVEVYIHSLYGDCQIFRNMY